MAKKIEWMKYLGLGAGAVGVPVLVGQVSAIANLVAKVPDFPIFGGVTVHSLVLAGLGVGLVDHFFFK